MPLYLLTDIGRFPWETIPSYPSGAASLCRSICLERVFQTFWKTQISIICTHCEATYLIERFASFKSHIGRVHFLSVCYWRWPPANIVCDSCKLCCHGDEGPWWITHGWSQCCERVLMLNVFSSSHWRGCMLNAPLPWIGRYAGAHHVQNRMCTQEKHECMWMG